MYFETEVLINKVLLKIITIIFSIKQIFFIVKYNSQNVFTQTSNKSLHELPHIMVFMITFKISKRTEICYTSTH